MSFPDGSNTMGGEETNFDRSYVKKKLEHGLSRIWQVCFWNWENAPPHSYLKNILC